MIWFTCKKCGKTHGRADSSAGMLVFCDCGNGNTVPWESTAPEPSSPPVVVLPKVPDLSPIQFDPVNTPAVPSSGAPKPVTTYPTNNPLPVEDDERPNRRGRTEKRDPDFCFNHQRRPKVNACSECEESFCASCLVKFQGDLLCAPCKNFLARRQELPAATSTMATASLAISLIAGPLMMCLLIMSPGNNSMRVLSLLSLLPQVIALGLGIWVLREAESEKKGGGQWVALTGVTTASLTCLMMLLLQLYANRIASPA